MPDTLIQKTKGEIIAAPLTHALTPNEYYYLVNAIDANLRPSEIRYNEEELGSVAESVIDLCQQHLGGGATPLRTKLCRILRPYFTEPKREISKAEKQLPIVLGCLRAIEEWHDTTPAMQHAIKAAFADIKEIEVQGSAND